MTVEEQRSQSVRPGADVTFICTAKSKVGWQERAGSVMGSLNLPRGPHSDLTLKSPAYTLVWTRLHNGKLPSRAMDFNGILTIRDVHLSDAGTYVCTGSNMFAMDKGTATLHVQGSPMSPRPSHRPRTPPAPGLCSISHF